ncbi:MAG TPA: ABC transporter permease subunit [Steroidobacteraceae bacterium]|nr:ABC transporter permease subunit [Steroidobacteraceae bacterium]
MLAGSLVVARKELLDHFRDTRALLSNGLYTLMGPALVALLATSTQLGGTQGAVMASVFVLVAAFTGGMTVATDMLAGERERRSLLPLILSSPSVNALLVGKWLAAWVFATLSSVIAAMAFAMLLRVVTQGAFQLSSLLWIIPALAILTALAVSLQILLSALSRNVKESTAYASVLSFAAMGVAMWLAFRPVAGSSSLWPMLPVAGHQRLFLAGFTGQDPSVTAALISAATSAAIAIIVLAFAARLFRRNVVNYGK